MALKPPVEVPQGAIRLNTDSQKLEFFAQDQWWEMATDVPTLNGGARGVIAGGHPASNVIQYITISTAGNAIDFGDLSHATSLSGGCASNTRGLITGDYPSTGNDIDYITIASTGNGTDFGDLTNYGSNIQGMCASDTRVVRGGGSSPNTNVMDFADIMTAANFSDFGDLNTTGNSKAGCSNGHGGLQKIKKFINK